jgi:proteasome accessory factor C
MSADNPRTDAHERLRRLLFLVPYVARNPGLTVEAVARELGVTQEKLLEELDLLTLVGRPPFQPDDFVDIYVEDDKLYVDLDQRLSAPPRLTASEGVALAAAAALLKPAATDALKGALLKLEGVLPPDAVASYRQMSRQLDVTVEGPSGLAALSQAIVEHREVELHYFTASRGQTELRQVQPWELFSHRGQWYLSAWCLTRGGERLFRLDRIASLSLSERTFTPPESSGKRSLPGSDVAESQARVRFSAQTAAYIRERFGTEVTELPGGELEVLVPADSLRWLTRWVLSFGGEAVVLEPRAAVEAVLAAARALTAP